MHPKLVCININLKFISSITLFFLSLFPLRICSSLYIQLFSFHTLIMFYTFVFEQLQIFLQIIDTPKQMYIVIILNFYMITNNLFVIILKILLTSIVLKSYPTTFVSNQTSSTSPYLSSHLSDNPCVVFAKNLHKQHHAHQSMKAAVGIGGSILFSDSQFI